MIIIRRLINLFKVACGFLSDVITKTKQKDRIELPFLEAFGQKLISVSTTNGGQATGYFDGVSRDGKWIYLQAYHEKTGDYNSYLRIEHISEIIIGDDYMSHKSFHERIKTGIKEQINNEFSNRHKAQ